MTILSTLVFAEAGPASPEPLFGNQLYALAAVLVGVAAVLFAVAAVGRWLASTHPQEGAIPAASAASAPQEATASSNAAAASPSPEVFAVIAAAVAATFGSKAQIASINKVPVAAEEETSGGRLQWSMEGRRQIYSSHKVR